MPDVAIEGMPDSLSKAGRNYRQRDSWEIYRFSTVVVELTTGRSGTSRGDRQKPPQVPPPFGRFTFSLTA